MRPFARVLAPCVLLLALAHAPAADEELRGGQQPRWSIYPPLVEDEYFAAAPAEETPEERYRRVMGERSTLVERSSWRRLPSLDAADFSSEWHVPDYGTAFMEDSNGDVYLYGKRYNEWDYNTIWRFDTEEEQWENLLFDDMAPSDDEEGARWFAYGVSVHHPEDPTEHAPFQFIVAGVGINGYTQGVPDANYLSSTRYLYSHAASGAGAVAAGPSLNPGGNAYTARINPKAVQYGQYVYLHAGCQIDSGGTQDLRRLTVNWPQNYNWDTNRPTLTDVTVLPFAFNSEGLPSGYTSGCSRCMSRCGHSLGVIDYDELDPVTNATVRNFFLVIWGGHDVDGFRTDLWHYDLPTQEYKYIDVQGATPSTRAYHSTVTVGAVMLIYGGDGPGNLHLNDLWAYFARDQRWIFIDQRGEEGTTRPGRRAQHSAVYLRDHNAMAIYGGVSHTPSGNNDFLNDMWAYGLGCASDCSGNGQCIEQVICECNRCWGGTDCATYTCIDRVIDTGKKPSTSETAADIIWPIVVAVVGGLLLVLLVALLIALGIFLTFRRWRNKKRKAQAAAAAK